MYDNEAQLCAAILRRLGVDAVAGESPTGDTLCAVRVEMPGTAMGWWIEYIEEALELIYDILCLGTDGYVRREKANAERK